MGFDRNLYTFSPPFTFYANTHETNLKIYIEYKIRAKHAIIKEVGPLGEAKHRLAPFGLAPAFNHCTSPMHPNYFFRDHDTTTITLGYDFIITL